MFVLDASLLSHVHRACLNFFLKGSVASVPGLQRHHFRELYGFTGLLTEDIFLIAVDFAELLGIFFMDDLPFLFFGKSFLNSSLEGSFHEEILPNDCFLALFNL